MSTQTQHASSDAVESGTPTLASSAGATFQQASTLANLQAAYSGESNAHIRYLAFAKQAELEKYSPVASLFRAAARAEEIHSLNHADVIRRLGCDPSLTTEAFIVRSTRENIEAALKGEIYERDQMYPNFLQKARAEGIQSAVRTFHFAQKAETEHAALFTAALRELTKLRGESVPYYVCPVCGFTTAKAEGPICPVCATVADRFERVI